MDILGKVRVSKTGQKMVTIPREAPIEEGDYVRIEKLDYNGKK